jgi:branched-chain amino acid transport system ATP-binding protein
MFEIKNLRSFYGENEALSDINITVPSDKIVCIIGANGAGKTTLLNSISGMVTRTGSIIWQGQELIDKSSVYIAKQGIAHVPEGRLVFPGLDVEDNLITGTISWHGLFGGRNKNYEKDLEKVYDLFPRLYERRRQGAWSLSGGEQQMLALGRAMMARPKLLLLDEPSMGLAPLVVEDIYNNITKINKEGTPILLVEQNAKMALKVSYYSYVIELGKITLEGNAKDIAKNPLVIEAYLGATTVHHEI